MCISHFAWQSKWIVFLLRLDMLILYMLLSQIQYSYPPHRTSCRFNRISRYRRNLIWMREHFKPLNKHLTHVDLYSCKNYKAGGFISLWGLKICENLGNGFGLCLNLEIHIHHSLFSSGWLSISHVDKCCLGCRVKERR